MRWHQITQKDDTVESNAKEILLDLLMPYKVDQDEKVPLSAIIQKMMDDPRIHGDKIDSDFIIAMLHNTPDYKVEIDPETGEQAIFLQTGTKNVDQKNAEKDKDHIRKAALRTVAKDMK